MNGSNPTRRAASTYVEQEILNESPLAHVARVYEMTGHAVARARAALAARDLATKGVAVNRASRCLSLLQSSLDMDQGGEVARNLDRLYAYLLRQLSRGHLLNDDSALAEVGQHVAELGLAWRQVATDGEQAATAAAGVGAAASR